MDVGALCMRRLPLATPGDFHRIQALFDVAVYLRPFDLRAAAASPTTTTAIILLVTPTGRLQRQARQSLDSPLDFSAECALLIRAARALTLPKLSH